MAQTRTVHADGPSRQFSWFCLSSDIKILWTKLELIRFSHGERSQTSISKKSKKVKDLICCLDFVSYLQIQLYYCGPFFPVIIFSCRSCRTHLKDLSSSSPLSSMFKMIPGIHRWTVVNIRLQAN